MAAAGALVRHPAADNHHTALARTHDDAICCAATATDYVRIRRFSSTGTFVQLHDLLCSRKHARVTANGRPGAFHVDRLCWPGVVRAGIGRQS